MAAAPVVIHRASDIARKVRENRSTLLVGAAGAFTFVLSAIRLTSMGGSSSHPTGTGSGAVLFRPRVMALLGTVVLWALAVGARPRGLGLLPDGLLPREASGWLAGLPPAPRRTVATVGIGAMSGVTAEEVLAAVDAVLPQGTTSVRLATVESRAEEPGLAHAAARRGWPLTAYSAAELATVAVPSPSSRVAALTGTPSVAEAAALLGGGSLVVGKTVHGRVTVAVSA